MSDGSYDRRKHFLLKEWIRNLKEINNMIIGRDFEECLVNIKEMYHSCKIQNEALRNEIKKLKEEHYKDAKMSEMKQRLEEMQKEYYRGFPISDQEQKAIDEWKRKHDEQDYGYNPQKRMKAEGCSGGRYEYIFVPTGLGISGTVVCSCGAKFEFQKIG